MKDIKISFRLSELPAYASACKNGCQTLACTADGNRLVCSVQYDFHEQPLMLSTDVHAGDLVELILISFRIELRINGQVQDEEWPAGNRLFERNDTIESELDIHIEDYTYQKEPEPAILSAFTDAEGWRPSENVFVGDCMPYVKDDVYHVLYLKDRHHHRSKWHLGAHQWEHISTEDFVRWSVHPMAVGITDQTEESICTGSWIEREEREYLFYTIRMADGSPAPISRSISTDGVHFEKDRTFAFTLSAKYHGSSARDPKVIKGADGLYHMFLTTSLTEIKKGCLAHLVSQDLDYWQEEGKPIYISEDETQPECADYMYYAGRYYLIYSLPGKAYYMFSDRPFDGWRTPPESDHPLRVGSQGCYMGRQNHLCRLPANRRIRRHDDVQNLFADKSGELIFR